MRIPSKLKNRIVESTTFEFVSQGENALGKWSKFKNDFTEVYIYKVPDLSNRYILSNSSYGLTHFNSGKELIEELKTY